LQEFDKNNPVVEDKPDKFLHGEWNFQYSNQHLQRQVFSLPYKHSVRRYPTLCFDLLGCSNSEAALFTSLYSWETQTARILTVNSAACYISVKLKFGVVWVQEDLAQITTSRIVKA
jgi:hypothetical protein